MHLQHRFGWHRFVIPGIICLIGIIIPLAQYYFRRFDDNTFTSWHMIFSATSSFNYFFVFLGGVLSALILFKIRLPLPRALFLFLACFVAAAFFWSMPEVNTVSARYVTQAKYLELYGVRYFFKEWGHSIQAWMDLPAIPFLNGIIFGIVGESRIYIQILTAFLFGMTSVVTYLIGKSLWDEETGFYAGILLLGIPYLIIQTPLMLLDVHTMFFLTLSIYLYIRALEGGLARAIVAGCSIFVAFFCKYSVWPMLSVLPVISFVYYFRKEGPARPEILRRSLRVFLLTLLLIGVPVLLKFDVIVYQIKLMMEFLRPSLGRWTEKFSSIYLFQISPAITIAAAASIVLAAAKRDLKYLVVVWLPFLAVFFEIKRVRYILPVFPMLTLMGSYGLAALRSPEQRKAVVTAAVTASLVTCYFLFLPFLNQWSFVNLKHAGEFLDTLDVNTVEAIAIPQQHYPVNPAVAVPLLDLYTHKRISYEYVPGASTPDEDYHTSRFRDSWEYVNPPFYAGDTRTASGKTAFVIIAADPHDKIPPELNPAISAMHHEKAFSTNIPFFYNQTLVTIYW